MGPNLEREKGEAMGLKSKPQNEKCADPTVTGTEGPSKAGDLWGAMRGTGKIAPGVDLTEPTGEVWDAKSES